MTMDWMNDSNCIGYTKLMFSQKEDKAKAKCAKCIVAGECLEFALSRTELHGVWGGLNVDERLRLSSRRLLARRFPSEQHNNTHEHRHLASASLSSQERTLDSQHHTPEVLPKPVALRVSFR